jgi:hypothetical protein
MRGFLVGGGGGGGAVDFDEHEAGGIIGLLHDIEPGNPGFLHALAGVLEGCALESLDAVGPHLHVDMDDKHGKGGFWPGYFPAMTTFSSEISVWPAARATASRPAPTKSVRQGGDFAPRGAESSGWMTVKAVVSPGRSCLSAAGRWGRPDQGLTETTTRPAWRRDCGSGCSVV